MVCLRASVGQGSRGPLTGVESSRGRESSECDACNTIRAREIGRLADRVDVTGLRAAHRQASVCDLHGVVPSDGSNEERHILRVAFKVSANMETNHG
jgi:hypothetical protein